MYKKIILLPFNVFMLVVCLLFSIKFLNSNNNEFKIKNIENDTNQIKLNTKININNFIEGFKNSFFDNFTIYEKQGITFKYLKFKNNIDISNINNFSLKLKEIESYQKIAINITNEYNIAINESEEIVYHIINKARLNNIDGMLLLGLIESESGFQKRIKSNMGAMGLTQIMPKYHKSKLEKYGIINEEVLLEDISLNIEIGIWILKDYIELSNGNIKVALQKYNGSLGDPDWSYSNKILQKSIKYKKLINI